MKVPSEVGMVEAATLTTNTHQEGSGMVRTASLFGQILGLVDRLDFLRLTRLHHANRYTKRFTAWDHFVAMLFGQFAQAGSLQEICDGLRSVVGKAMHLGVRNLAKKSTLAYANEHRPAALFRDLFFHLSGQLGARAGRLGSGHKFRFHNRLVSLDATVITLCLSLFPWAEYTRTKGGVKLHALLDHDGYWPTYAHITTAKASDLAVARTLALPAGSIVVMDRGYLDYELWGRWTREGVHFVTRLKANLRYQVLEEHTIPPSKRARILRDETIQLNSARARQRCPYRLRRVVVWDEANQREVVLVTNHERFAADTIGQIYRDRWQIELFFKALKQRLKVKTFLGTSRNALEIQLWTALIAMLLVKFLQWCSRRGWSLARLVALLQKNLFQYKPLWAWLDDPFETPPGIPDHPQLHLPGFGFGQLPPSLGI